MPAGRCVIGVIWTGWRATARAAMEPANAAMRVAAILQRVQEIRAPGGNLQSLAAKAGQGMFSPGPMIIALLQAGGRAA